jgi:hypothetical protein
VLRPIALRGVIPDQHDKQRERLFWRIEGRVLRILWLSWARQKRPQIVPSCETVTALKSNSAATPRPLICGHPIDRAVSMTLVVVCLDGRGTRAAPTLHPQSQHGSGGDGDSFVI